MVDRWKEHKTRDEGRESDPEPKELQEKSDQDGTEDPQNFQRASPEDRRSEQTGPLPKALRRRSTRSRWPRCAGHARSWPRHMTWEGR